MQDKRYIMLDEKLSILLRKMNYKTIMHERYEQNQGRKNNSKKTMYKEKEKDT